MMDDDKFLKTIDRSISRFESGFASELEQAIGTLALGRKTGWKPLLLMHSRRTIRKYEDILNIKFRDELDPTGPKASKSVAWEAFKGMTNFWDAVSGKVKGIKTTELKKK